MLTHLCLFNPERIPRGAKRGGDNDPPVTPGDLQCAKGPGETCLVSSHRGCAWLPFKCGEWRNLIGQIRCLKRAWMEFFFLFYFTYFFSLFSLFFNAQCVGTLNLAEVFSSMEPWGHNGKEQLCWVSLCACLRIPDVVGSANIMPETVCQGALLPALYFWSPADLGLFHSVCPEDCESKAHWNDHTAIFTEKNPWRQHWHPEVPEAQHVM